MTAITALGQTLICVLIRIYQCVISPLIPGSCRFYPTCSGYAIEAIATHGTLRGLRLSACRILRCNPWGGAGLDPVPSLPNPKRSGRSGPCDHHRA